jgi:hypothetical protein
MQNTGFPNAKLDIPIPWMSEKGLVKEEYLKSPCDVFDIVDMLVHIKVSVKWLQGEIK